MSDDMGDKLIEIARLQRETQDMLNQMQVWVIPSIVIGGAGILWFCFWIWEILK